MGFRGLQGSPGSGGEGFASWRGLDAFGGGAEPLSHALAGGVEGTRVGALTGFGAEFVDALGVPMVVLAHVEHDDLQCMNGNPKLTDCQVCISLCCIGFVSLSGRHPARKTGPRDADRSRPRFETMAQYALAKITFRAYPLGLPVCTQTVPSAEGPSSGMHRTVALVSS